MTGRTFPRLFRRDQAEVGVGTLIVFIAMVLVAAVAAAVIISTSGSLQERAMVTGKEATQEVSANFRVINAYGLRDNVNSDIDELHLYVELSAGAPIIALEDLVIRYSDGTNERYYKYADADNPFTLEWIRGDGTNNVIRPGDLVDLTFATTPNLEPRATFELALIPLNGEPVHLNFVMPSTYGSDTVIRLR